MNNDDGDNGGSSSSREGEGDGDGDKTICNTTINRRDKNKKEF